MYFYAKNSISFTIMLRWTHSPYVLYYEPALMHSVHFYFAVDEHANNKLEKFKCATAKQMQFNCIDVRFFKTISLYYALGSNQAEHKCIYAPNIDLKITVIIALLPSDSAVGNWKHSKTLISFGELVISLLLKIFRFQSSCTLMINRF